MSNLDEQYFNLRLPDQRSLPFLNTHVASGVADLILAALPEDVRVPLSDTGGYAINSAHVPYLANLLQEVVAYTVASIIDAGSERDAVMENCDLSAILVAELEGWTAEAANG